MTETSEDQIKKIKCIMHEAGLGAEEAMEQTPEGLQNFISCSSFFCEDVARLARRYSLPDKRFRALSTSMFKVPDDYEHECRLAEFLKHTKKNEKNFDVIGRKDITDAKYFNVSSRLIPGRTYKVTVYKARPKVRLRDCLIFLYSQNAFFVGAQGLSAICQYMPEIFPLEKWLISLDVDERLLKDFEGQHRLSQIYRERGKFYVRFGNYGDNRPNSNCLLCFNEIY